MLYYFKQQTTRLLLYGLIMLFCEVMNLPVVFSFLCLCFGVGVVEETGSVEAKLGQQRVDMA
jgi:hypothetical protein